MADSMTVIRSEIRSNPVSIGSTITKTITGCYRIGICDSIISKNREGIVYTENTSSPDHIPDRIKIDIESNNRATITGSYRIVINDSIKSTNGKGIVYADNVHSIRDIQDYIEIDIYEDKDTVITGSYRVGHNNLLYLNLDDIGNRAKSDMVYCRKYYHN